MFMLITFIPVISDRSLSPHMHINEPISCQFPIITKQPTNQSRNCNKLSGNDVNMSVTNLNRREYVYGKRLRETEHIIFIITDTNTLTLTIINTIIPSCLVISHSLTRLHYNVSRYLRLGRPSDKHSVFI